MLLPLGSTGRCLGFRHERKQHDETAPRSGGEWWRSAVIYQVYPRSFADASGDGMGDLPGSHRDCLAGRTGVDAVWLSPFFPSPQKDAGYDVSDYCAVDPRFGTLRIFRSWSPRRTRSDCA